MDGSHFDTLVRGLARSGSRRGAVRALVTGWLAAAGVAMDEAPALGDRCKKVGKKCTKKGDCCRDLTCKGKKCACKRSGKKCGNTCCESYEVCVTGRTQECCHHAKACDTECCGEHRACYCPIPPNIPGVPPDPNPECFCRCADGWQEGPDGECVCPEESFCFSECCETEKGEQCCAGNCTNVLFDKKHCGECGHFCTGNGELCIGGECQCPFGTALCGSICVDLSTHTDHCGECHHVCFDDHKCVDGQCQCQKAGQPCEKEDDCCDADSFIVKGACSNSGVCRCCTYIYPMEVYKCCSSPDEVVLHCHNDRLGHVAECCKPGSDCEAHVAALKQQDCDPTFPDPVMCNV